MRPSKCVVAVAGVLALQLFLVAGCTRPQSVAVSGPVDLRSSGLTRESMPTHPFMLFDRTEVEALARRKDRDPLLAECWTRLQTVAEKPDVLDRQESDRADWWGRDRWWYQLEARALVATISGDKAMTQRAISLLARVLKETDPSKFYSDDVDNFLAHGAPLRALGLAWDWLYPEMTPQQRAEILPGLENWCDVCFTFTNRQWWREASYNVGAIPIGGIGILSLSIRPDSTNPKTAMWLRETTRRIGQNFYPTTFKRSGICWEGPNYSIVGYQYPAVFSEALRRAGGDDQLARSGVLRTMQYQMHQWMPQGGCAPIGDNTGYGTRTFAAEYLLGIGRTRDAAGLWTWRTNAHRSVDAVITYLWYPLDLQPVSPAQAGTPAAQYFEVTENRAGYFFSRTKWQDPDAAFFAFVTRYERSNHQHYDMNSFLLGAYGTLFATHEALFPYGDPNHGVDFEHNMIIVGDSGWPRHDNDGSCGDDNSTEGVLVGLATGPFADYVRGDAKWSYRDNSLVIGDPAIRAERACLFVKAGQTPYMIALDDIQFSHEPQTYRWQWYAPDDVQISGEGTTADPLVMAAEKGSCALSFVGQDSPAVTVQKIQPVGRRGSRRTASSQPATAPAGAAAATSQAADAPASQRAAASRPARRDRFVQRIDAVQEGVRVRYAAVATLQRSLFNKPALAALPVTCENPSAAGVQIRLSDRSTDHVVWQSEEVYEQRGSALASGQLQTDGLVAMVRVRDGQVIGYVLGEGTYLKWGGKVLVEAPASVCVTADRDSVKVAGSRQARRELPAIEPVGVKTFRP